MAHEDEQKDKKKTGFAGLSTMVSNVEAVVQSAAKQAPAPILQSPTNHPGGAPASPDTQSSSKSNSASTGWIWFVAVLAISGIGIGLSINAGGPTTAAFSPTSQDTPLPYDPPSQSPAFTYPPASVPQVDSEPATEDLSSTTRPSEEVPRKGSNLVLTTAQIRYCVAEDIRLEAADGVVNEYDSASIDRFNGLVDDYNSRCAAFQYRNGALEAARNDLRPYRAELEAEGVARVSSAGGRALTADDRVESGEIGSVGSSTELPKSAEASRVPSAAERANFNTCISGEYPILCKHEMLTPEQAVQVGAAERRANFNTCISGEYPVLCKHEILTPEQAVQVAAAERRANFNTCISGEYPILCKHEMLTPEQAVRVRAAEARNQ